MLTRIVLLCAGLFTFGFAFKVAATGEILPTIAATGAAALFLAAGSGTRSRGGR